MSTARERRHQDTYREILDAAWAQAEERGVAGISLRDVAAAVGMRAPSLYTYFSSKDAIYDAMFSEGYQALARFGDEIEKEVAGLERVDALVLATDRYIRFCQESMARYQLMFTRAIPGWEPSSEAYAVSVQSYEAMARALSRLGVAGADVLDLFTAITGGMAAQQMANDPTGDRWRRLTRPAMEMLVEYLDRNRRGES